MAIAAEFRPIHVERKGSLTLPLPLSEAFALFTPEGERAWIDGWAPEYLHPLEPSTALGTVFRTTHDGEETLWMILSCDPGAGSAAYCRITPGNRLGTVRVSCVAQSSEATRVEVTYALTAMSAAGNAVLEALTPAAYTAKLAEWEESIRRALRFNAPRGPAELR